MSYNNYEEYAEELRAKASLQSSAAEELEKRYKEAVEQNRMQYEETKAKLDKDRYAERNAAASEAMKQKQSSDQILASRGLSDSGEHSRTAVLAKKALDDTLDDIDDRHGEAHQKAAALRSEADISAAETLSKGKAKISKQIAETRQKLEQAEQNAYNERVSSATESASAEEKAHDARVNGTQSAQSNSSSTASTLMTEKEMAKNIISSCCEQKAVKNDTENAYIRVMLENLKAEFGFDDAYKSDLAKLLTVYGYVDMSLDEAEGRSAAATAADNFDRWVSEYYRSVRNSTYQHNLTAYEVARNKAKQLQKEYVYMHCTSLKAVRLALKNLGYNNDDIEKFIKQAQSSDEYSLGMSASYKQ